MILNKKHNLHKNKFFPNERKVKNKNHALPARQRKMHHKNPLPKFLKWLTRQIYTGNRRFALDSQDLILYKPASKLIFILPEVFEKFYIYSRVSPELIQYALKSELMVTFDYTIVREKRVIEVFPCDFFKINVLPESPWNAQNKYNDSSSSRH